MRGREIELTFANAMHQLDTGDCHGRVSEAFEPNITLTRDLMWRWILLDQIV